ELGSLIGDDKRSDWFYSTYGQMEYKFSPEVTGVAAARVDVGSLIDPQLSPKFAIVYTPNERNSFRLTVNRAFQMPNYSEFFLHVDAQQPVNLSALENAIRASALGPALTAVPSGQLFGGPSSSSAAVHVTALGNRDLKVETTLGVEAGYRGDLSNKVYFTLDSYINRIRDFVTDLLPVSAINI